MDNPILTLQSKESKREKDAAIVLILIAVLTCTFLRASLLIIYPLVVLFASVFFRLRLSNTFIFLLVLVLISLFASFFGHAFFRYKFLSLFYMIPFLLLLFSNPVPQGIDKPSYLSTFIKAVTAVAVVNDLIGFVQVFINAKSDDSFLGIYSQFSISVNGLMLVNTLLFFYYLVQFIYKKGFINLSLCLFFLACSMLGFYGAGLVICIIAFLIAFFRASETAIVKTVVISTLVILGVYFALLWLKPLVLEYNLANIRKISSFDVNNGPRKIKSFYNYGTSYPKDIKDFLLGSGPGTFNSRTAFLVGSPSYFSSVSIVKDDNQPYYFKNYAYTLWNEQNTVQALYLDGFRNQPFSSVLSFLGEYGLIFSLAFFVLYYYYFLSVSRLYRTVRQSADAKVSFRFFKFLMILLPLLLLIDNYYEYPEIMLLFLLGIKFSHLNLVTIKRNSSEAFF